MTGRTRRAPAVITVSMIVGLLVPSAGRAAALPIPQDQLFEVLKKQSSISFSGERTWTQFSTDPDRGDFSYRQRVLHRVPFDYRVDLLSSREEEGRHFLAVKEHVYFWPEERGDRKYVAQRERREDETLGLVLTQNYLQLLQENYEIDSKRGNPVAGRETYLVRVIPKYEGRASVRVWVDQTWGVPLLLERYDPSGRVVLRMKYNSISLGAEIPEEMFQLPTDLEVRPERRPKSFKDPEALFAELEKLSPVAEVLPAGFRLAGVTYSERRERSVVQSFYSDGYCSISLFAVSGQKDVPAGANEPGIRSVESRRRRGDAIVQGWIGEVEVILISGRLPEYELIRMIHGIQLSSRTPEPRFLVTPPPGPPR